MRARPRRRARTDDTGDRCPSARSLPPVCLGFATAGRTASAGRPGGGHSAPAQMSVIRSRSRRPSTARARTLTMASPGRRWPGIGAATMRRASGLHVSGPVPIDAGGAVDSSVSTGVTRPTARRVSASRDAFNRSSSEALSSARGRRTSSPATAAARQWGSRGSWFPKQTLTPKVQRPSRRPSRSQVASPSVQRSVFKTLAPLFERETGPGLKNSTRQSAPLDPPPGRQ